MLVLLLISIVTCKWSDNTILAFHYKTVIHDVLSVNKNNYLTQNVKALCPTEFFSECFVCVCVSEKCGAKRHDTEMANKHRRVFLYEDGSQPELISVQIEFKAIPHWEKI